MASDETTGLLTAAERAAWQLAASRLHALSVRYGVPAQVYAEALDTVRLFGEACERAARAEGVRAFTTPRPLNQWHEDVGPVLWWRFPVDEPPYVGTPLDSDWPDSHTHWTPVPMPTAVAPEGA